MTDEPVQPADFSATLAKLHERSKQFRDEWNKWFEEQPSIQVCENHQHIRRCDFDASHRESWSERQMLAIYESCPKCNAIALARRQQEWMLRAGVPELLLIATFDNFNCRTAEDHHNLKHAREFAVKRRGFLVMRGKFGTGKSHLAVAVMRAIACGLFLTQNGLLKKLRETYRDERAVDIIEKCKTARLLVLDEVGLSTGGRDELPMLHEILSERHNSRRPTVLTSNATSTEELYSFIGERMADRLKQSGYKQLVFSGQTKRPEYREQYLNQ